MVMVMVMVTAMACWKEGSLVATGACPVGVITTLANAYSAYRTYRAMCLPRERYLGRIVCVRTHVSGWPSIITPCGQQYCVLWTGQGVRAAPRQRGEGA